MAGMKAGHQVIEMSSGVPSVTPTAVAAMFVADADRTAMAKS
jgi:hypothetical protein